MGHTITLRLPYAISSSTSPNDSIAPASQKYPAKHSPVGSCRPTLAQYLPGAQSTHYDVSLNPVRLLYVPRGHGSGDELFVPQK